MRSTPGSLRATSTTSRTRCSRQCGSSSAATTRRRSALPLRIEVLPDAEAVAKRGAEYVAEQAAAAVSARGHFAFAVSGARTPLAMFAALEGTMPWEHVTIFQVDERVAPAGDPDRNLTHLLRILPPEGAGRVRAMPVEAPDLEAAAAEYAAALPETLDLVQLGIGTDGHTASLVPGDTVLDVTDRDVAVTGDYQGRRRMTLTYPPLDRARHVLWLVAGEEKAEALARLRAGDLSIPAGRVSTESSVILADRAAAALFD